jgi:hypothetical protein
VPEITSPGEAAEWVTMGLTTRGVGNFWCKQLI